ncbi:hypothetical protein [Tenacibaculum sp. M341]|uniref:hypothetical protein n=1 Tax=Tenacibaculum sp. M341 TaxID=2530339 RepID=UPI00104CB2D3|nr:hypothetical protein [Tenacibaculum sp. M341]TCI84513.1 hypothetical protein EYW44_20940 [Tenacibaculum sp. M341]
MIKKIALIFILFCFSNCKNYESEDYINQENKAINQIIPEITNLNKMIEYNNWDTKDLKLFIYNELIVETATNFEPEGYTIGIDGVPLSEKRLKENKKEFEEKIAKYEKEEKLFAPLKKRKIKTRSLQYKFNVDNLKIELVNSESVRIRDLKKGEFGILAVSRIIFNRNYSKGYLYYTFYCGSGCAWDNNIEIQKIDGKWKITEYFSGGIA